MIQKILLLNLLFYTLLTSYAQIEICNNGIDDDGDELIDCFDLDCRDSSICANFSFLKKRAGDTNCVKNPEPKDIKIVKKWQTSFLAADQWTPIVGDIDKDGNTDILCKGSGNTLLVLNGNDGTLKFSKDTVGYSSFTIGDIDNDDTAEIIGAFLNGVGAGAPRHLICYEHDGKLKWISDLPYRNDNNWAVPNVSLANFNGDDTVEVYVGNIIYNAFNGKRLMVGSGSAGADYGGNGSVASVAVDILDSSAQCPECNGLELVCGNQIYGIDITNRQMTVRKQAPAHVEDGFTAIGDINLDGQLDIISKSKEFIYVWDAITEMLIRDSFELDKNMIGVYEGGYIPTIGNVDNDPEPEIALVMRYRIVMLDNDMTELWSHTINDYSSAATMSTFYDLNCDGRMEVIYRDEDFLYIFEGATGIVYDSLVCTSATNYERPIIADIDNDGSAEILCGCRQGGAKMYAFESALEPWTEARNVMNQQIYFGVNINDDLTIPRIQQKNINSLYPELNSYPNQINRLDEAGFPICYEYEYYGDVIISIDSIIKECESVSTLITICNISDSGILDSGLSYALYKVYNNSDTIIHSDFLSSSLNGGKCISFTIPIDEGDYTLFAIVNGNNTSFLNIQLDVNSIECKIDNNIDSLTGPFYSHGLPQLTTLASPIYTNSGTPVQLSVSGAESYIWTPGAYLNDSTINTPISTPESDILYMITGTDSNGCFSNISLEVLTIKRIFAPNAFSPYDGINNQLVITGKGISSYEVKIYNKFGHLVFESYDPNIFWDGSYKSSISTSQVFVCKVQVTYEDDSTESFVYNVTLIE